MIKKILIALGVVFILFILGSIILVSLSGPRKKVTYLESPYDIAPLASPGFTGEKVNEEIDSGASNRLVIKTGTINMVVKDIKSSVKSIIQHVKDKGGWVVSSSVTEKEKVPLGNVTVRIPSEVFDETMDYSKALAEKVSYEGTQGRDVTEEYVDLQSRLRNLEATETQLLNIMERSGTIPDVLAAQKELTKIRGQIEQTKGKIQYLERSAEMATITINLALSEDLLPIPPAEKWRPKYVLLRAWHSVLGSLRGISYFLIWIGVYSLIWVPLGIIVWKLKRFWKRKKEVKRI